MRTYRKRLCIECRQSILTTEAINSIGYILLGQELLQSVYFLQQKKKLANIMI